MLLGAMLIFRVNNANVMIVDSLSTLPFTGVSRCSQGMCSQTGRWESNGAGVGY